MATTRILTCDFIALVHLACIWLTEPLQKVPAKSRLWARARSVVVYDRQYDTLIKMPHKAATIAKAINAYYDDRANRGPFSHHL